MVATTDPRTRPSFMRCRRIAHEFPHQWRGATEDLLGFVESNPDRIVVLEEEELIGVDVELRQRNGTERQQNDRQHNGRPASPDGRLQAAYDSRTQDRIVANS